MLTIIVAVVVVVSIIVIKLMAARTSNRHLHAIHCIRRSVCPNCFGFSFLLTGFFGNTKLGQTDFLDEELGRDQTLTRVCMQCLELNQEEVVRSQTLSPSLSHIILEVSCISHLSDLMIFCL